MNIRLFIKAQFSALIATALDFTVSALMALAGLYYVRAAFLGALAGGGFNCFFNYQHVFRCRGRNRRSVAVRYLMVWAASLLLNTLLTFLLTELTVGERFFLGPKAVAATIVALAWNYPMQKNFVYKC